MKVDFFFCRSRTQVDAILDEHMVLNMSVLLCTCVNSFPYFSTPTCSAQFCPEMLPSTSLSCTLHTYIKRRRNRILHFLKVSKFQKQIFLFSFEPVLSFFKFQKPRTTRSYIIQTLESKTLIDLISDVNVSAYIQFHLN